MLVPEGERQVGRPNALPPGYTLKSVQYGSTVLAGVPLRVTAADTAELRFTITTPDFPPVKVSGKVSGLDLAKHLLIEAGWIVLFIALSELLYRRGLQRYSGFGG